MIRRLGLVLAGLLAWVGGEAAASTPPADRPAIERLDEIRQKLLDQDGGPGADGERQAQWYNWPNWGNWNNWPNWGNWLNW